ncbi:MAG: Translation initiation factor 3 subunit J component [Vezdaea aestivalis]|nr:MAG: Translation initiation factor 3 subunit J component [Vezdaea aestivalis]
MAPEKSKWATEISAIATGTMRRSTDNVVQIDDEDDSTPPSSPPVPAAARRSKFEDEEDDDSDVPSDWEGADDSEEEAAKSKAAAEAKAKADALAAANKKSKTQRIAEREAEKKRQQDEEDEETDSSEEDESSRRDRLRQTEQASDLKHAEDLFGDIGVSKSRANAKAVVSKGGANTGETVDLASLPLFNPTTKDQFTKLRDILVPILAANNKKGHYSLFLQEFCKQLAKDMPSDQIKKVSSTLTALGNERMKEEKSADKTGKKTKAQKTKTTLAIGRSVASKDVNNYADEDFGDDDFM